MKWNKSTFSSNGGNCVEFARIDAGQVTLRDSKDPNGPTLTFTRAEWIAFVNGVRNNEFNVE